MLKLHHYYHTDKIKLLSFLVPTHASVLDVGCGSGDLLYTLQTQNKVGIDSNASFVAKAKKSYPSIKFFKDNIEKTSLKDLFDYVLCVDVINTLHDIETSFKNMHQMMHKESRLVITFHNHLWQPIFSLAEKIGLKEIQQVQNWLSVSDVENLLYLADLEVVKKGKRMICPIYIPLISNFLNRYISQLPLFSLFCVTQYIVARQIPKSERKELGVSVIVPARNEKGNIESIVKRTPNMGVATELIFIEGHSSDGTWEEIQRVAKLHASTHKILFAQQEGKGKGDAVRKGFSMATMDILMILDADMTVPPEELPKFYNTIVSGRADFVNGSRLVYEMEAQAMRFLNILGNKFFASMFSWLLSQKIKDTLCGTKVLTRKNYEYVKEGRTYFGDFDPFGDFDLLFGASKLNLKIVDLPIRYKDRVYGTTQIQRFRHGWLLLQMCVFAAKKIKFIQ